MCSGPADVRAGPTCSEPLKTPHHHEDFLMPTLSLPSSTLTTAHCWSPEPPPSPIPSEGWTGGILGGKVLLAARNGGKRGGCLCCDRDKGMAGSRRGVGAHPLPTFLPHSIHDPLWPQPWFPGERAPRRPSSQTTSCCPLPIQTLATKHSPPALPARGDSLLATVSPFPPSVRSRCRQTVRTVRGSSSTAWTPPSPCRPSTTPHTTSFLSPRLCLPFPCICLHLF